MSKLPKILFVCVENTGRSQMAEGFFRKYGQNFDVLSAGTEPKSTLIAEVVEVMKEIGIDITNQKPKLLSNEMINDSIKTINMGCIDKKSCPSLFVKDVLDWNIRDPKGKTIEEVRKIREQIKFKVLRLIKKLEDGL
ncbi:MAG TPA: arsenate reductase ArsC [Nitrosopumilaceae archaeon]|nr:arsenate reductase ArsC [Nitrosopumilaceae archaeon]